jgi:RHS repeat-associated protein
MTKGGPTYYYHINGHGDITTLSDVNGSIVAQYQYDAWGNIVSQSGTMASANPYRYAGYQFDESLGLYYLTARYYDSNIGRFMTRDTFQGFKESPLSLNQYAYTKNNPVMYVDHSGHFPWHILFKGLGAGIYEAFPLIWNHYIAKKSLNGIDWWKVGRYFVVGFIMGVAGIGWAQATKGLTWTQGLIADVHYAVKDYTFRTLGKGEIPSLKGLGQAIFDAAVGRLKALVNVRHIF